MCGFDTALDEQEIKGNVHNAELLTSHCNVRRFGGIPGSIIYVFVRIFLFYSLLSFSSV